MKNTWFLWFLGVGVVITILIALNFEGGRKTVPLNEIFPDENQTQAIEYEFADAENELTTLVEKSEGKKPPSSVSGAGTKAASPQVPAMAAVAVPQASGVAAPGAAATTATVPLSGKAFTVQIASFRDEGRAQKAIAQAKDKGYAEAFIDSNARADGGVNYQICVGRFSVMAEAKSFLTKLQQDYKDGFIKNIQGRN